MSSHSFNSFTSENEIIPYCLQLSLFLSTRSQAAFPPSRLVSTPPTPTSPPLSQTPRRSALNPQTHQQRCPVYRRTSAGWPTTVSPSTSVCWLDRKRWACVCFCIVKYFSWRHSTWRLPLFSVFCISFSPVHATLKSTFSSLVAERDRLRHTVDLQAPQPAQVVGLKTAYASVSVTATQKSWFFMSTCHPGPVSLNWLFLSGMSTWLQLLGPPVVQWEQSIYPRVHIRVFWCSRVPPVLFLLWEWGETLSTTLSSSSLSQFPKVTSSIHLFYKLKYIQHKIM